MSPVASYANPGLPAEMAVCLLVFSFQLALAFNIILYLLWVSSIVVRQLHNLQRDPPDNSSTHLAHNTQLLQYY